MRVMSGQIACVVFDLDDTLYLERDFVASGFRAVAAKLEEPSGITSAFEELWGDFEAGVRGNNFDVFWERRGLDRAKASSRATEMVRTYREHHPRISLPGDSSRALAALAAAGYTLGLITDGDPEVQVRKIEALGITDRFEVTVFTGSYGPDFQKPHKRAFREIEELTGLKAGGLVYIADNPAKDFAAPFAMGWHTIRIRRRASLHEDADSPPGEEPEMEFNSLEDIFAGVSGR